MTVTEFAEDLAQELGEDYSDVAVQTLFVNWAIEGIKRTFNAARLIVTNHVDTFITVAGTATYTLDSLFTDVSLLYDSTNNRKIGYNPIEKLANFGIDLSSSNTGDPLYWFYTESALSSVSYQVTLVPVPDDSFTIVVTGYREMQTLTSSSVIPLKEDMIEVTKDFVRSMFYSNNGRQDMAQSSFSMYAQFLGALVQRYAGPPELPSAAAFQQGPANNQSPSATKG